MKKPLGIFILVGAIATAAILVLRTPKPAPEQTAPSPSDTTPADSSQQSASFAPGTTPASVNLPALTPATPAAVINPATPLVPAATTPTSAATPVSSGPVTKHPKTLSELYRAFDAINAAAEATTPASLASLVDFAATENADVRTAAINAIINRDDASAAPLLRKAAKQLDDSKAIIALLETADYIELPSATMTAISARPKTSKAPRPGEHRPVTETAPNPPAASP